MSREKIASSELILNPDGSVYHLKLRREDVAETVLTVGDPDRVEMVSRHFDKIEVTKRKREFITHTGTIGNKRLTVISTGIGTDNIDIVLNELDALFNIDFETRLVKENLTSLQFLRLGTSGALQPGLQVNSLLASSYGLSMDGMIRYYRLQEDEFQTRFSESLTDHLYGSENPVVRPVIFPASNPLLEKIGKDFYHGITASCSGFYGPQGRVLRLQPYLSDFPDRMASFSFNGLRITNLEMETGGLYALGSLLGHRCLSVNVLIANRAEGTFSKDPEKAVNQMIEQVLERIVAEN